MKRISPEISISNNEFDNAENNKAVNESIDLAAVLSSVCNLLMLPSNMMSSKIVSNNKTCLDHDNNMSRSLASTYDLDGIVRCILIYGRSREVN